MSLRHLEVAMALTQGAGNAELLKAVYDALHGSHQCCLPPQAIAPLMVIAWTADRERMIRHVPELLIRELGKSPERAKAHLRTLCKLGFLVGQEAPNTYLVVPSPPSPA